MSDLRSPVSAVESILEGLSTVACHTRLEGDFVDPGDPLARFLLGPEATVLDLAERKMDEFYVHPEQRRQALAAVKAAGGEIRSYTVLLELQGVRVFCRCRAGWQSHDDTYQGTLTRLGNGEIWLPGEMFQMTGWAFFQSDADDRTTYASPFDATLVGRESAISLCGESRLLSHWSDESQQARLFHELAEHETFSGIFEFKHRRGQTLRVQMHAARRSDRDGRMIGYQAIWRDITEEYAAEQGRREALDITIGPKDSLPQFERSLTQRAAKQTRAQWAAYYRRLDVDRGVSHYILRAIYGQSDDTIGTLITSLASHNEAILFETNQPARTGPRRYLIPIPSPDEGALPLGCFLIELREVIEPLTWHVAFGATLGLRLEEFERMIADRAASELLTAGVELLVTNDPDRFWPVLCRDAQKHIAAEGCSVFTVDDSEGRPELVLRTTSGLIDVPRSQWRNRVRYAFGEGLTGSVAQQGEPCGVLDVEQERGRRGLPVARFCEKTEHGPQAWMGYPIRNRNEAVVAFIRATNRLVRADDRPLVAGFSNADQMLLDRISTVVRQYSELRALHEKHQAVIARTYHELRAPLISIRNKAYTLTRKPDHPHRYQKYVDVNNDAELLLNLLSTIETAAHEQKAVVESIDLNVDVLNPLRAGLRAEAMRAGYRGIIVDAHLRALPRLRVDPRLMRQIFYNLLVNAIKYGPVDKERHLAVQVEADFDDYRVRIVVRDWGMGVDPRHSRNIFNQFYRTDEAFKRAPNSSGIGLFVPTRRDLSGQPSA